MLDYRESFRWEKYMKAPSWSRNGGFAGFIGDDIDKALDAFRQNGLAGVGLKAVLTETNQVWSSLQLFEELKKEHAQMHGKR